MIEAPLRALESAVVVDDWNVDAVRTWLWEHHRRKCYLCECPISRSEFEVDHRVPQRVSEQLVHCSVNLFPACRSCNGRRGSHPKQGGLLCPGFDSDLEARLEQRIQRIDATEVRACFSARDPEDLDAINTAAELHRIHSPESGTTPTARARARDLLDAIVDHYAATIAPLERKVLRARRRSEPDRVAERDLGRALARSEPFTMLLHSLVAAELGDLLEQALAADSK